MHPDAVVMLGDLTSGDPADGVPLPKVQSWWAAMKEALAPLRAAGIPVLPIPGNHDQYTAVHRQAYEEAWSQLAQQVAPLRLSGRPAHAYSCRIGDAHLCLASMVDQNVNDEEARFLREDLAAATTPLRLVFGHVPAQSAMTHVAMNYRKRLVELLAHGGASAYFCGHEHLYWDELIELVPGQPKVRQVIVGTPGAAYTWPLRADLMKRYCNGRQGVTPYGEVRFGIDPVTRKQLDGVVFVEVITASPSFRLVPWTLDQDGRALHFDLAARTRWLQTKLNGALALHLEVTGVMDPPTVAAVRTFQAQQQLAVDGIPGPLTRAQLRRVAGA